MLAAILYSPQTNVVNEAACYTLDFVSDYGETPLELCMVIYHLFMCVWRLHWSWLLVASSFLI